MAMRLAGKRQLQKVAAFDIDGTLFRSSLLVELINVLIERGSFPESMREEYRREEAAWLKRRGSYEDYIEAVVRAFGRSIKGVHYADFADVSSEVARRHQHLVYRYTRDLVRELKKNKYFLLAVSQSPKTVVEVFCKQMGFDKVYGSFYELGPEARFTGAIADIHLIKNKAAILRRAIELEGLTLSGSYGVGDTESDISMLELVEYPIAFNPNAKLYRYARRMGWETIVERKDVIYAL